MLIKSASVALMLLVGWITWSVYIEPVVLPPVVYWDGSFQPEFEEYHPGDDVRMRVICTKRAGIQGEVSWSLVNQRTAQIEPFLQRRTTVLGPGYSDSFVKVFSIPKSAQPDVYFGIYNVVYQVSELKSITYSGQSSTFRVTKKDSDCDGN